MSDSFTVSRSLGSKRPSGRPKANQALADHVSARALPLARTPRIARLLALAIKFDGLVRQGVVEDYAALARLGHVSRARISQIMNLLHLAPDIQEAILFLPPTERGRDPLPLRRLQPICACADWSTQRRLWSAWRRRCLASAPSTPLPSGPRR